MILAAMQSQSEGGYIQFVIPYEVAPKQSDRSRVVNAGKKSWVQHYQPAQVRHNAEALVTLAAKYRPAMPLEGPLVLRLVFTFRWLKSHKPRTRLLGTMPKETKPDLDNLEKQLCDVLQRAGFFANDAQIFHKTSEKRYGDSPSVSVFLCRHGEEPVCV